MRRRAFITLLGGAAAAWPLASWAQQDGRVALIGWLDAYDESDAGSQSMRTALREGLAKLGWIEGRNLKIERRFGAADANRLRSSAVELVSLAPDVIIAGGLRRRERCSKRRRPSRSSSPGAVTRPPLAW
jgi:putative ABC transport system substrate-binding protein